MYSNIQHSKHSGASTTDNKMDKGRTSGWGGVHQRHGGDYPTANTWYEKLAHRDVHCTVG